MVSDAKMKISLQQTCQTSVRSLRSPSVRGVASEIFLCRLPGSLTIIIKQHPGVVAGEIGISEIMSRIFIGNYGFIHILHRI